MKYLKSLIYILLLSFILLASMLAFLFTTTPGLYTTIKLVNLFLPGKIHVKKLTGQLTNHFAFDDLTYIDDTIHIQLTGGNLAWKLPALLHPQLTIVNFAADNLFVSIQGSSKKITKKADLTTLHLPCNLQINKLTISQVQIQQIGLERSLHKLQLEATLTDKRWLVKHLSTEFANIHLVSEASGQLEAPYTTSATLQFTPLIRTSGLHGQIQLNGNRELFHWQGQLDGPAHVDFQGTLKNGIDLYTQAKWNDTKWRINSSTFLQSSHGKATITGTLTDLLINAETSIEAPLQAEWQITARIKNKQANLKSTLHVPTGNLKTTILANATLFSAQKGTLALTINPGVYQLPPGSPISAIPFKGGDLLFTLTPEALQGKGLFTVDPNKTFSLALRIPKFRLNDVTKTSKNIDGKLNLQINSLDFLQGISKTIDNPKGQLALNLTATGALTKPIVKGELILSNGSVSLPKSGLTFKPIQATLHSSNNHWQALGSITSSGQALTLKGQGDFAPLVTGQLNIQGENFLAMKTAEYTINLSPQLTINFNPTSLELRGNILVPSAQLKPISFSNTVTLSEDVIFVNKEATATPTPLNLSTDIDIKMGQNVDLEVKGLHGFLDGAIHIKKLPHGPSNATGELTVRDGKYQAYGQNLTVEQGQLLFAGGSIDNPGIRIRAIRKFNNTNSNSADSNQLLDFHSGSLDTIDFSNKTTVGIELSGRLNAHKITLFSIPPTLSQSDILSMLILGKPASQASKSGGQLLITAISSMNLDSGKKGMQLIDQLKQSLGVDFNVQNNTLYNQKTNQVSDSTAVVVTKSLSKRVFVSYNIGLLQADSNVLTLKYLLNKFFTIQVNTSDSGSGIDLLYTHGKD